MTNQAAVETVNEFDFISYGLNVARRVRENLERQWNPQPETENTATVSEATPDPVTAELAGLHGFNMDMLAPVKDALLSGKLNVGDVISKVVAANKTTTGTVEDAIGDAVKDILGDTEADPKPAVQVRKMPPRGNRKPN
jgi:hypothetical protein